MKEKPPEIIRANAQQLPRNTGSDHPIAQARLKAGLTQRELGDMLGVPFRSITNWESGARKCPEYVERLILEKLAQPDYKATLLNVLDALESKQIPTDDLIEQIKQSLKEIE